MKSIFKISVAVVVLSAALSLTAAAQSLEDLGTQIDNFGNDVEPQKIFGLTESIEASRILRSLLENNETQEIVEMLEIRTYSDAFWQIIVSTVDEYYIENAPGRSETDALIRLFLATVKPSDNWMNYSPPRGWSEPYSFRRRLGRLIIFASNGFPSKNIPRANLLESNPIEWVEPFYEANKPAERQAMKANRSSEEPAAVTESSNPDNEPPQPALVDQKVEETTPVWPYLIVLVAAVGIISILVRSRKDNTPR
jgi:hypothetical protein